MPGNGINKSVGGLDEADIYLLQYGGSPGASFSKTDAFKYRVLGCFSDSEKHLCRGIMQSELFSAGLRLFYIILTMISLSPRVASELGTRIEIKDEKYLDSITLPVVYVSDDVFKKITISLKCIGCGEYEDGTRNEDEEEIYDFIAPFLLKWRFLRIVVIEDNIVKKDVVLERAVNLLPEEDGLAEDYLDDAMFALQGRDSIQIKTVILIDRKSSNTLIAGYIPHRSDTAIVIMPRTMHTANTFHLREESLSMFPPYMSAEIRKYIIEPYMNRAPYRSRNLVLVGPPGIGKSTLAKAILRELGYREFLLVSPGMYRSKWYGESEKILEELLGSAEKNNLPIIFDNAEYVGSRNIAPYSSADISVISEVSILLNHLETNTAPVFIVANSVEPIDKALLRHGRIDIVIVLLYPDREWRMLALKNLCKKYGVMLTREQLDTILYSSKYASISELDASIKAYAITGNLEDALRIFKNINQRNRQLEEEKILSQVEKLQNIVLVYPKNKASIRNSTLVL